MADLGSALLTIPEATDASRGIMKGLQLKDLVTQQQMNQLQLSQAQRADKESTDERNLLKGLDFSNPEDWAKGSQRLSKAGYPELAVKLEAQRQNIVSGKTEADRAKVQLVAAQQDATGKFYDAMGDGAMSILATMDSSKDPAQGFAQARAQLPAAVKRVIDTLPQDQPWAQQVRQQLVSFLQNEQLQSDPAKFRQILMSEIQQSQSGRAGLASQRQERHEGAAEQHQGEMIGLERERLGIEKERAKAGRYGIKEPQTQEGIALKDAYVKKTGGEMSLGQLRAMDFDELARSNQTTDPAKFDKQADQLIRSGQGTKAAQATRTAFDKGPQGDTVRSQNVVVQHLDVISQAGNDLHNKDTKSVNRFYNALATEFGKGNVTGFDVAKQIVGDEIVKAVMGRGAGGVTDRQELQSKYDAANSPEQLQVVVNVAKKLLTGQLRGLRKQFVSSVEESGETEENATSEFNNKLDARTRAQLDPDQGAAGGAAAAGGSDSNDPLGLRGH